MSLRPEPIGPVPEETSRVAHAVFRRGNVYLKLRDELGRYDIGVLWPSTGVKDLDGTYWNGLLRIARAQRKVD